MIKDDDDNDDKVDDKDKEKEEKAKVQSVQYLFKVKTVSDANALLEAIKQVL